MSGLPARLIHRCINDFGKPNTRGGGQVRLHADAPGVIDMEGFVALYERIGQKSGWHQYETAAAQETARQVRSEIR